VLDAEPGERDALVERLSGGDGARRRELEQLIAECDHEPALLIRSAAELFGGLLDDDAGRFPESLAERFRLERELARGGMATVYLAHDLKHARDVAVKVIRPAVAAVLGGERFHREIEIAAQLRHPHIVPLYDSGDAGGTLYYVMPYEPGLSLRQRLSEEGPLPVDDVVLILRDVCDALAFAHERGIVHCDIKPDNVLLSGRHALVTDFGVARAAKEAAPSGSAGLVFGTPSYMAPEQAVGDRHMDHRVDIYAVGVLAYELLTGHVPFPAESAAVPSDDETRQPTSLATYRRDVPASLSVLVMRCLATRPDERWQSADELLTRLVDLAASRGRPALLERMRARWKTTLAGAALLIVLAVAAFATWQRTAGRDAAWQRRWASARVDRLTDFAGSEVDAAISADGRYVAFLADRDSLFDAFVTRVGSGRFANVTGARVPQLFNEDVRNLGFSADGSRLWVRVADISSPASVQIVPTTGGPFSPFLRTAVMAVWSPDGSTIAYHETTPGDPIYLTDSTGANPRRVYVTTPGLHNHHLSWSPDGRHLYFSHGVPPNEMDIWRVAVDGGEPPERITRHNSKVAYPVLLDERTLAYTATADDGSGPWLYSMSLGDRRARRVNLAVEHYLSIAASAESIGRPRRMVATVSNPDVHLWSVPITDGIVGEQSTTQIALPTARSAAPRFSADTSILYLASRSGADGLWRLSRENASELWSGERGAVVGAAAVSPDGRRVCFPVRHERRSTLHCMNADGGGVRALAESLDVRGAGSWSPDGNWIAIAAMDSAGMRVFKIPLDGGAPVRLVGSVSSNPVWSPDGSYILYSGVARGRSVPVHAVTPGGAPHAFPSLTVDRVGDSYRFLPGGTQLVVKLGGFRRQDFWLLDARTGTTRQLTKLRSGESLQRFDVSPDGRRILFERVRENSDVVLIELPPP
jgi:Tol biopolymer transport system component